MEIELLLSDLAEPTGDGREITTNCPVRRTESNVLSPALNTMKKRENDTEDFHSGDRIAPAQLSFQPGQLVWAKYRGKKFFPGIIVSTSGENCEIQWDIGCKAEYVNCNEVRDRVASDDTPTHVCDIAAVDLFNRNALSRMSLQPFTPSRSEKHFQPAPTKRRAFS